METYGVYKVLSDFPYLAKVAKGLDFRTATTMVWKSEYEDQARFEIREDATGAKRYFSPEN